MSKIIALTGEKGCGKDTTAQILQRLYSTDQRNVAPIAFADPIKNVVMHIFGLSNIREYDAFKRSVYASSDLSLPVASGRHIVREIGMLMRQYDVNQFVEYVDQQISADQQLDTIWVITDLRFDNELIHLRNLGAKVVKIKRQMIQSIDTHITERGFDDASCDLIIENQTTLSKYEQNVKQVFDSKLSQWGWL